MNKEDIHYSFYKYILTHLQDLEEQVGNGSDLDEKLDELREEFETKFNTTVSESEFTTFKNKANTDIATLKEDLAKKADTSVLEDVNSSLDSKIGGVQQTINVVYTEVQQNKNQFDDHVKDEHDVIEELKNEGLWSED